MSFLEFPFLGGFVEEAALGGALIGEPRCDGRAAARPGVVLFARVRSLTTTWFLAAARVVFVTAVGGGDLDED